MTKNNESSEVLNYYNLTNEHLNSKDFTVMLGIITGHIYVFARGNSRIWGENGSVEDKLIGSKGFYQIMPNTEDDGFFHWYCYHRENEQWFETKENCVLHFLFYRRKWTVLGKPSPF